MRLNYRIQGHFNHAPNEPARLARLTLGPDYMANFTPGWNFNPANRAEILLRLHD